MIRMIHSVVGYRLTIWVLWGFFAALFVPPLMAQSQTQHSIDSLHTLLQSAKEQERSVLLSALSGFIETDKPQEAKELALQAIASAQKNTNLYDEAVAEIHLSAALRHLGRSAEALAASLRSVEKAFHLPPTQANKEVLAKSNAQAAINYRASAKYDSMLFYANQSLALYDELHDRAGHASLLVTLSYIYWNVGKYAQGMEFGLQALRTYEELGYKPQIARTLNIIGLIYRTLGDHAKALDYFQQCLALRRALNDNEGTGVAMSNIGAVYKNLKQYDSAMKYFENYLLITQSLHIKQGLAIASLNIGSVQRLQGKLRQALYTHKLALSYNTELGDKRGTAQSMSEIGADLRATGKFKESVQYLERSIALADSIGAKNIVKDSYAELSQTLASLGEFERAYFVQMKFDALNSTLITENRDQIIAIQNRHDRERSERERQMQEERIQQQNVLLNVMVGLLVFLILVGFVMVRLYRKQKRSEVELREKNSIIEKERELSDTLNRNLAQTLYALEHEQATSDRLLLNVLPESIAERMKAGETTIADHFESVTVLFADLVGFTSLASRMNPVQVVEILDSLFSTFDALAQLHGVEKIKTIGDAYLAVCGVPRAVENHTENIAAFALDMCSAVSDFGRQLQTTGEAVQLEVRIGIHVGEVVAGVIGKKKFSYDLWGDTVNTASRMESHGDGGKIHVSEEVFLKLNDKFTFEERGEIEVKGKGVMRTWFLTESTIAEYPESDR
jgi:class 3 adenylate cyclase/Tfp pilus assembly protein PilF